jgi:hypothetical protein
MNTYNEYSEYIERYIEEKNVMRMKSYISMYYRDLYDDLYHERKKQTSNEDDYLYRIGVNDDNYIS